jgi:hypothetical protein
VTELTQASASAHEVRYSPSGYSTRFGVLPALNRYGVGLVDNAQRDRSAQRARRRIVRFMLSMAPLVVVGGTGSPINPIATF